RDRSSKTTAQPLPSTRTAHFKQTKLHFSLVSIWSGAFLFRRSYFPSSAASPRRLTAFDAAAKRFLRSRPATAKRWHAAPGFPLQPGLGLHHPTRNPSLQPFFVFVVLHSKTLP